MVLFISSRRNGASLGEMIKEEMGPVTGTIALFGCFLIMIIILAVLALNMGAEYLLMSIAVVIIGGTAVAGGDSNVPGIWGASLFMFLVVSMLNTYGFGAGPRLVLTGLIIIAVILVAGGRPAGGRCFRC